MRLIYILSVFFAVLFHLNGFSLHFYCVAKNGQNFPITPHIGKKIGAPTFEYGIAETYLTEGAEIKFEPNFPSYTVTAVEIAGGKIQSLKGYLDPYAFFIYAKKQSENSLVKDRIRMLIDQCIDELNNKHQTNLVFSEVRVSRSAISGLTDFARAGYPLVYIQDPIQPGKPNIKRVKVE